MGGVGWSSRGGRCTHRNGSSRNVAVAGSRGRSTSRRRACGVNRGDRRDRGRCRWRGHRGDRGWCKGRDRHPRTRLGDGADSGSLCNDLGRDVRSAVTCRTVGDSGRARSDGIGSGRVDSGCRPRTGPSDGADGGCVGHYLSRHVGAVGTVGDGGSARGDGICGGGVERRRRPDTCPSRRRWRRTGAGGNHGAGG